MSVMKSGLGWLIIYIPVAILAVLLLGSYNSRWQGVVVILGLAPVALAIQYWVWIKDYE